MGNFSDSDRRMLFFRYAHADSVEVQVTRMLVLVVLALVVLLLVLLLLLLLLTRIRWRCRTRGRSALAGERSCVYMSTEPLSLVPMLLRFVLINCHRDTKAGAWRVQK